MSLSATSLCRCYPGVGDLDASDDEDAVLLENPAYENCMQKGLKVCHFSQCPMHLLLQPQKMVLQQSAALTMK